MAKLNTQDFDKWLETNLSTLSNIYEKERKRIAKAMPSIFTTTEGFSLVYMVDPSNENKTLEIFLIVLSDSDLPNDTLVSSRNLADVNESKLSVSVSELLIQIDKEFNLVDYQITTIPRQKKLL